MTKFPPTSNYLVVKHQNNHWLALMIGNSRLHWAYFTDTILQQAWDTPHIDSETVKNICTAGIPTFSQDWMVFPLSCPLYLASVVPEQTTLWQNYSNVTVITLDDIPLLGIYPTLGIDRALAVWGAGQQWGWPILVVDAGTALTFTGADEKRSLVGGAILPGLGLQLKSLNQKTASLPIIELPDNLPPRWALNTSTAIQSGVVYGALAGIRDFIEAWCHSFPGSAVVLTGGDTKSILSYLKVLFPQLTGKVIADSYLIFLGICFLLFSVSSTDSKNDSPTTT